MASYHSSEPLGSPAKRVLHGFNALSYWPALKKAKGPVAQALCLGLDTAEQSKRAAAAIYLIEYSREDAAPAQRQVLARLDEWVESAVIDVKRFTGQESIMKALVTIRADVLVTPSTSSAEQTDATDRSET